MAEEPTLATENASEPQHGDQGICRHCGGLIEFIVHDQWAGDHVEVLDAWWAHDVHPDDHHDAEPSGEG